MEYNIGVSPVYDTATSVLASSLARRAPGYTSLGFPNPLRLPHTPSARTESDRHALTRLPPTV